jgi:RNA polymerase sigma-70 factor (ECF subfamily)
VALNAWLSHARRQIVWHSIQQVLGFARPVAAPPLASARAEQDELAQTARRELMRLPARYREPIILRIDDECDYADIAAILSLTPSGARTRVARGLKILRGRLGLLAGEEFVP